MFYFIMTFISTFFFNDTATTDIYTLSLHDALPICLQRTFKKSFTSFSHSTRNKTRDGLIRVRNIRALMRPSLVLFLVDRKSGSAGMPRPISYAVFCLKKKKK